MVHMPPGSAIPCRTWRPGPHTDFLVREDSGVIRGLSDSSIILRQGLFLTGEVAVVPFMFRIGADSDQLFEIWFNYHAKDAGVAGPSHFRDLVTQEDICFYFYGDGRTRERTLTTANRARNFFRKAVAVIIHMEPWTADEFDRARAQVHHRHRSPHELWDSLFTETSRQVKIPDKP